VDLLPNRSAESTEQWLRRHTGVEIISRDRASLYAEAATRAAPQAVQVADRWHLVHNLTEALIEALAPHHRWLAEVACAVRQQERNAVSGTRQQEEVEPVSRKHRRQQNNRERRLARYQLVMEQIRQGVSPREAARRCGIGRRTVRRWIAAGCFPERKSASHRSALDK
jgi:transposase